MEKDTVPFSHCRSFASKNLSISLCTWILKGRENSALPQGGLLPPRRRGRAEGHSHTGQAAASGRQLRILSKRGPRPALGCSRRPVAAAPDSWLVAPLAGPAQPHSPLGPRSRRPQGCPAPPLGSPSGPAAAAAPGPGWRWRAHGSGCGRRNAAGSPGPPLPPPQPGPR